MFKSRRNKIQSDEGFVVEIRSARGGLTYREGERYINVDSEFAAVSKGLFLYEESIGVWHGPSGEQPASDKDRRRVIDNIIRAFQFEGYSTKLL